MVKIEYTEEAGSFLGLLKVEQPDGSVVEMVLPKPIIDLIKASIQDGSMDVTALLARTANIVKDL